MNGVPIAAGPSLGQVLNPPVRGANASQNNQARASNQTSSTSAKTEKLETSLQAQTLNGQTLLVMVSKWKSV